MSNHYLIHLPHCGTKIPEEYIKDYFLDKDDLEDNVYQYADLFTDELFSKLYENFGGVKNEFSRLFFDPERFGDDKFEHMHADFGLGWFYENAILEKKPLRSIDNKDKIRKYFDDHHKLLNKLTQEKLDKYGQCTVIDCHSFSNERYWFHKDFELPDICVGFEDKHVDNKLLDIIKSEFTGFTVGINESYVGSLVPTNYWGKDFRVKSVMIEINKKLYLEKDNVAKSANFEEIKQKLENIYSSLTS